MDELQNLLQDRLKEFGCVPGRNQHCSEAASSTEKLRKAYSTAD